MDVIPFPTPLASPPKPPQPPERADRAHMIVDMIEELRSKPSNEVEIMVLVDALWRGHVIRHDNGLYELTTRGKAAKVFAVTGDARSRR
jgi:hypothetical protein